MSGRSRVPTDCQTFLDRAPNLSLNPIENLYIASRASMSMIDVVDRETRSRMMAGIKGRDTKPELALRRALHARGLRYRLHDRKLAGKPDLAFRRFGAVCFVHGCFWHRHPNCPFTTVPATRTEFWQAKFKANVNRDQRTKRELLEAGWRVAIIWECSLRGDRVHITALALERWLRGIEREFETSVSRLR